MDIKIIKMKNYFDYQYCIVLYAIVVNVTALKESV